MSASSAEKAWAGTEVVDPHERRCRNYDWSRVGAEELCAAPMRFVASVEQSNERPGVGD